MRTEARTLPLIPSAFFQTSAEMSESESSKPLQVDSHLARRMTLLVVALSGLIWDLYSKWAVFERLGVDGTSPVWNGTVLGVHIDFQLATAFNRGALWGVGQNWTWLFASLSFLAVGIILYFVWNRQATSNWWLTIAVGLLLAGTIGNLYDRLSLHGWKTAAGPVYAVRDFLDVIFTGGPFQLIFKDGVFHWATFNFADSYLVTGAIMLVIQSFWTQDSEVKPPKAKAVGEA